MARQAASQSKCHLTHVLNGALCHMAPYFGVNTFQSDCPHCHRVFLSLSCILANGFDLCSGIRELGANARAEGFLLHMYTKE